MANETEFSDAEFQQMFAPPPAKDGIQLEQDPALLPDATFKQAFAEGHNEKPTITGNVEYDGFKPWVDYYAGKWQNGEASVTRGIMGTKAIGGETTYEQIQQDASIPSLKSLQQENLNTFESRLAPWDLRLWVGRATESLPFMREIVVGGAKGAAVGAGLGAGTAAVAGQLGPQAALPEELATVPAGAAFGGTWGYRVGAFTTSSKIMAGQLYLDLRDRGLTDDTAKPVALAGGAVQGLIEAMQMGQLSSAGRQAFIQQLNSTAGQATLRKFMGDYVKEVGIQVAEEDLQESTALLSQTIAAWMDKNPGAVPTADEIMQRLIDTTVQSAQASAVLVGGSKATGTAAGATTDTIQNMAGRLLREQRIQEAIQGSQVIQRGAEVAQGMSQRIAQGRMTLTQAFDIIRQGMEKEQPTSEEVAAAQGQDVDATLDMLQQPVVIQPGEPITVKIQKFVEALSQGQDEGQTEAAPTDAGNTNTETTGGASSQPTELPVNTDLPTPELQARWKKVNAEISQTDKDIEDIQSLIDARDLPGAEARVLEATAVLEQSQQRVAGLEKKLQNKMDAGKPVDGVVEKLEEAYQKQEAAEAALAKAQKLLESIDPKKTATTALRNNLDRLYEKRSTLETERALLSDGLLTSEEIAKSQIQMTAGQVMSLRAKAVDKILKAFRKGVKEGVKFTRQDIREIQNEVISLVRNSGMTAKDQAKFMAGIKNIQSQAQLLRALPRIQQRIDSLIEAEAKRKAIKRTDKLLKQSKLAPSGKRAVSKFSANTQKILDIYRKAIEDPEWRFEAIARDINTLAQNVAELDKAADAQNQEITPAHEMSQRELLEAIIARRVGDYENKSAADTEALAAELQYILDTGRAEKVEQKLAEAEARQQNIQTALESINGNRPVDTLEPTNSALRQKTIKNELTKLIRTLGRTVNSWDGLMTILSQHDPNGMLRKVADVFDSIRVEYKDQMAQRDKLIATLVESVNKNKRKVLDRIVSGSKIEEFGSYVNQDGENVKLVMSRNEAINLWVQMQDPDLEAGLKEGNKYTFTGDVTTTGKTTQELLDENLTAEDKQLGEGLVQFYNKYYDRVNTEWEDETGASLEKNDRYSGYARRSGTPDEAAAAFFHEQFSRSTIKPASTIGRTENTKSLEPQDAFVKALKHVQDFEHWIAWRKTDKRVRGIFGNREVRNAIKLKFGEGMMRTIDDRYNDMIGTRNQQQADALKFLDVIRKNAGTAFVGGKALQFFKQMTAITNFLLHVNEVEFVAGVTDFVLHPKKAIETMEQSPLLKARAETFDRDLMEALQRDDIKAFKKRPTLLEMNLWSVKYGDRATVWAGGWAVYKAELAKTGDPEKAMIAFEKAFNSTQQSGTIDELSQLERSGPFGKMVTLFLKQPLQMLQFEMNSIRKAMAIPNAENVYKAVRTIAIVHTSAMLFQAVASAPAFLFGDDEDKNKEFIKLLRAAVIGPFAGLPILGDMITAAGTGFTNWFFDEKEKLWMPKFLPYDAAGKLVSFFKHGLEAVSDGEVDAEEFFKVFHDYARSIDLIMPAALGGGLPKEPYAGFFEWFFTEPEADK